MGEKQRDPEKGHRLGKSLRELEERMRSTEGCRIKLKIQALNSSYHVFAGNYHNLATTLDRFGRIENSMELWAESNRNELDRFMDEVIRLLHNFLAGAKTLVDHTRVFKNEMYKGKNFERVYQEKLQRDLSNSPIVSFVQDLRNYVLHKQLPITSAEFSFKGGEGGTIKDYDSTIKLNVDKLREWDGWKRNSQVYLDALDDKAKIKDVAEQYEAAIRSFYHWFGDQQEKLHLTEFEELSRLEAQYSQTWQEWEKAWGA